LRRDLDRGRVALRRRTIIGDLRLSGVVSRPFSCIDCDFRGSLRAANVSFRQRINLSRSRIDGRADFTGSTFSGDALFIDTSWGDRVTFDDSDFDAKTNFRKALFRNKARFVRVGFRGPADFDTTVWRNGADFAAARFSDASFVRAFFETQHGLQLQPALDISDVDASRRLNLDLAEFEGEIAVDRMTTPALVLDPQEAAKHVEEPDVVDLLRRIESTAKDAQNFALANDAFYERQIILSRHYSRLRRVVDAVFYRGIAGYLVRPLHPVLTLFLLIAVLSIFRASRGSYARAGAARLQKVAAFSADVRRQFSLSLLEAVRWRSSIPPGKGLEVFTYRLLVVCALVALYADPTSRQIFEFLRG
jgi:hypothetical protein